jgi:hypothetical protein
LIGKRRYQVWDKVQEELEELQVEVKAGDRQDRRSLGCFVFNDTMSRF